MLQDDLIELNLDTEAILEHEYFFEDVEVQEFEKIEVNKVKFNKCNFNQVSITGGLFYNTTFEGCDMSNIKLQDCYFKDCSFVNSKLSGVDFSNSQFKKSKFENCILNYSDYYEVKLEDSVFKECDLTESYLVNMLFKKKIQFTNCKLNKCNFANTFLKGIDLSTCEIQGLVLSEDFKEIKGCKLKYDQALDLIHLLKVEII